MCVRKALWGSFSYIVFEILLVHCLVGSRRAWRRKIIICLIFQIHYAWDTLGLIIFKDILLPEFSLWSGILRIG